MNWNEWCDEWQTFDYYNVDIRLQSASVAIKTLLVQLRPCFWVKARGIIDEVPSLFMNINPSKIYQPAAAAIQFLLVLPFFNTLSLIIMYGSANHILLHFFPFSSIKPSTINPKIFHFRGGRFSHPIRIWNKGESHWMKFWKF